MKKIALILGLALVLTAGTTLAQAQTTNTSSLLQLLQQLRDQLATRREINVEISETVKLVRTLQEGMSGEDVKTLQALLATDATVYPAGLVTGFYGPLTKEAVRRFQMKEKLSLAEDGQVGNATLVALRKKLVENPLSEEPNENGQGKRPCAIVPPGHLIAPGWLRKQGGVKPIVPVCQTLPPGIINRLNNASSTPPGSDTTAPILSQIMATSTTATTTAITWKTNELATSAIWYSTSTPIASSTTTYLSNSSLVLNHQFNLGGLNDDTIYYFQVSSADASGNTATSSVRSFETENN